MISDYTSYIVRYGIKKNNVTALDQWTNVILHLVCTLHMKIHNLCTTCLTFCQAKSILTTDAHNLALTSGCVHFYCTAPWNEDLLCIHLMVAHRRYGIRWEFEIKSADRQKNIISVSCNNTGWVILKQFWLLSLQICKNRWDQSPMLTTWAE
jgi:hypothetical protein